jgi:hypothetical protein
MITWIIDKVFGLMPFVLWAKRSFEENGEPSSRRFAAANCMMLISYMVYKLTNTTDPELRKVIWYGLLVLTGLMFGLITAGNILSFLNKDKKEEALADTKAA